MRPTELCELRLDWGFADGELVLDAEMTLALIREDHEERLAPVVLCHGRSVWSDPALQSSRGLGAFSRDAYDWLRKGKSPTHGLAPDPSDIHLTKTRDGWRDLLVKLIRRGIGDSAWEWIVDGRLADSACLVRFAVRARDRASSRIPVEVLGWPSERPPGCVSVVRLPSVLTGDSEPPSLAVQEPGVLSVELMRAYKDSDERLGRLQETIGTFVNEFRDDPLFTIQGKGLEPDSWFDGFDGHAPRTRRADVVVLGGHGGPNQPLKSRGGQVLSEDHLAVGLAHLAPCVLLSICHSAALPYDAPDEKGRSLAETISARGAALVIGFQGTSVDMDRTRSFLDQLLRSLSPRLTTAAGPLSILDWELATRAARLAGSAETRFDRLAPVLYVHPSLITGGRRPPQTRMRRIADKDKVTAVATCWHVPGQVLCFTDDRPDTDGQPRQLRVPLPVDVGVDLRLTMRKDERRDRNMGEGHRGVGTVTATDLRVLAEAFGLPKDLVLIAELTGHPARQGWANRSAELSAAVRGLTQLTGSSPPADALELLYVAVMEGWGAPDSAPRVIDIATGCPVARLDPWPPLSVKYVHRGPGEPNVTIPQHIPDTMLATMSADDVRDLGRLPSMVAEQHIRNNASAPSWLSSLDPDEDEGLIVRIPSRASVELLEGPVGTAPQLIKIARQEPVTASDELFSRST